MSRTRAERRHNTAVIKARREYVCEVIWGHPLSEGSSFYTPNGERRGDPWWLKYEKDYLAAQVPARQNTVRDADFEDAVIHHKPSTRTAPPKAKAPNWASGRKGRGVHPGADYCPIDSPWAIAHAAKVRASND